MVNHTKTHQPCPSDRVTPVTRASALTDRDRDVLSTLCHRVRTMSVAQIARTWWSTSLEPEADAERRITSLVTGGTLIARQFMTRPERPLDAPLACWRPGQRLPSFPSIAHIAGERWSEPLRAVLLVAASQAAARIQGGYGGRLPRTSEATHDVHLAGVYLWMRRRLPTRAASWRSEAFIQLQNRRADHHRIPDAIVRDGHCRTAIELVGQYSPEKLGAFHAHCEQHNHGYELW